MWFRLLVLAIGGFALGTNGFASLRTATDIPARRRSFSKGRDIQKKGMICKLFLFKHLVQ
jgi:hypothetical protein